MPGADIFSAPGVLMFEVRMFGGFEVRDRAATYHSTLGRKGRLIACFLFTYPNISHRREKLIEFCSTGHDDRRTKRAFNTVIWRLRCLLKKCASEVRLSSTGRELSVEAEDTTFIDLHRFEAATREVCETSRAPIDRSRLTEGLDAYVGPYLDGFDEEWILYERERLECLFIRCQCKLLDGCYKQGRIEDAIECGRKILAIDPLHESVQQRLMLLYVLSGRQGAAIRHFDRCSSLLHQECGVRPMPDTLEIAGLIKSGLIHSRMLDLCGRAFTRP